MYFPVIVFLVFFKCILLRKCFAQAKHFRRAKLDAYCSLFTDLRRVFTFIGLVPPSYWLFDLLREARPQDECRRRVSGHPMMVLCCLKSGFGAPAE